MAGVNGLVRVVAWGRTSREDWQELVAAGGGVAFRGAAGWVVDGCRGDNVFWPLGERCRGLRGTARTGEYKDGGGTARCRQGVAGLSGVVVPGCGRGRSGGKRGVWGREERGGRLAEGGLSRREGGVVSALGGFKVRLWII